MASNSGKIKKQDMVAAAIAGGKAKPTEGVAFVLERFGVTMTPDSFSQSKKTLAKKSKLEGGAPREAPKAEAAAE